MPRSFHRSPLNEQHVALVRRLKLKPRGVRVVPCLSSSLVVYSLFPVLVPCSCSFVASSATEGSVPGLCPRRAFAHIRKPTGDAVGAHACIICVLHLQHLLGFTFSHRGWPTLLLDPLRNNFTTLYTRVRRIVRAGHGLFRRTAFHCWTCMTCTWLWQRCLPL